MSDDRSSRFNTPEELPIQNMMSKKQTLKEPQRSPTPPTQDAEPSKTKQALKKFIEKQSVPVIDLSI